MLFKYMIKNTLIAVLCFIAISMGAWTAHLKDRLTQVQAQLVSLQDQSKKNSEMEEKIARAERKSKVLDDSLVATSKLADEKSKQAEQLQKSLKVAKTGGNNPFGEIFKDPAMKELLKSQQKSAIGPMIEKQYAELFQELDLTPEQTTALKSLLEQKMLAGMDVGMSMMDNSLDASQRADLVKQVKAKTDDADAQIKKFLGEENYKTFQTYEKTAPYRIVVDQFSDQLASGATPLSGDQQAQLIQAMSEESNGFKRTSDPGNTSPSNGDYASILKEDNLNRLAQDNEKLDQQVLARAEQILTPEQFAAFQKFQESRRTLQLNAMKMASKMFAPKNP